MSDYNYPDNFYADAQKPAGAYDSRKLYEETSTIAAAQDAKLDPPIDIESNVRTAMQYLYHAQRLLKEAFPNNPAGRAPKWSPQWLAEQSIPAESAYLASFRPNGAQGVNASQLGEFLRNEELKGLGIGDVEPATLRPFEWDEVGGTFARTVARHPANAEALRMADERTPEDRL